jgi:hypothetical protein
MVLAAAALSACTDKPSSTKAFTDDKVYTVTPNQVKVTVGVVMGEVTELKVTERIERKSGRIDAPARLSGRLNLKNSSAEHSVRLLGGKIHYTGADGQDIKLEGRAEPNIRFSPFGNDRLEPGQQVTHAVDVDFPVAALTSGTPLEIRLELMFLSSLVAQETARCAVSIGSR